LITEQHAFLAQARGLWPLHNQLELPAAAVVSALPASTSTTADHPAKALAHAADDHAVDHHAATDGGMGGRWIVWATLAGILAAAAWWFGSIHTSSISPQTLTMLPPSVATPEQLKQAPAARPSSPSLSLRVDSGEVVLKGIVDSASTAQAVEQAARSQFAERLRVQLQTDPALGPAPWLQTLLLALPRLDRAGLELELHGLVADLKALPASGPDASGALAELAPLFSKLRRTGQFDPAVRAFAQLPEQNLDSTALVEALNLMRVHFESGSRTLRDDSERLLQHAARVIGRAPADMVIEIGGHTDGRGDAQGNRELSEQRAFAVQEALLANGVHPSRLTARGYGASTPIAENSTREGRARNRRIEFTLLR
jgi:outer membrane protein OmpA-like peptidoglycan-associated protein